MKTYLAVVVLLLASGAAWAADLDGIWKGTMETPMGAMENTITLQASGETLTGMVKTDMFEAKAEKGAIKGDKVSFVISMDFGTLTYEGALVGDELKFKVTGPDGSTTELNCKRQK